MKVIADTLGFARSNPIEQSTKALAKEIRRPQDGDDGLISLIGPLIDARPSFVYRRVTALANRSLAEAGPARINGKRILRIMRINSLTLEHHTPQAVLAAPMKVSRLDNPPGNYWGSKVEFFCRHER